MRATRTLSIVLLAAAGACTENPIEPTLGEDGVLQIRPALVRTLEGSVVTLQAVAFDGAASPVFTGQVEWSSLDDDVLAVDDEGVVNAVAAGWGRVVARSVDGTQQDTAIIAVGLRLDDIDLGSDHGCGLADGTAYCWGAYYRGHYGVLGTGSRPVDFTPAPVVGDLTFSSIAAGMLHTCGIADGDAYCWGQADALGTHTCESYDVGCHTPERAQVDGPFTSIAVSSATAAATCASGPGGLSCWGRGFGVRPQGGCGFRCEPYLLSTELTGPVTLGFQFGCALDGGGRAWCWGDNGEGQLGNTVPPELCSVTAVDPCAGSTAPIRVGTNDLFTHLVGGRGFTCGLTAGGEATCWGAYYQWSEDPAPGATPVRVSGSVRFASLSAADEHVCGLTTDGVAYCWGRTTWSGAMAPEDPGEVAPDPRRAFADLQLTQISAGSTSTCGIVVQGETVCLGSGSATGQGFDTGNSTPLPIAPPGPLPAYVRDGIPRLNGN